MLGIKILGKIDIDAEKQKFDEARANNICIFEQVAIYSKKTRYLKGLVPIYEHLMDLWKEQSEENNTPWQETHKLLASTFLAKEFKVSRQKITRALLIFEYIGLIEKVRDSKIRRKEINNYSFNVITSNDKTSIIERAELIRDKFSKPREQVSRSKLNTLFNDE
jgi:DNA-binding transcriptional regulator YhcF (GntR family)